MKPDNKDQYKEELLNILARNKLGKAIDMIYDLISEARQEAREETFEELKRLESLLKPIPDWTLDRHSQAVAYQIVKTLLSISTPPSSYKDQEITIGIHGNECPHCLGGLCECNCHICKPDKEGK